MKLDLSGMPNTLDLLHLGLGGLAFIEAILLIILLSIIIIGLLRKDKRPAASKPQVQPATEKPQKRIPDQAQVTVPESTSNLKEASPDAALQLLGLLQQEARFVDFIEEDIASFSDSDIGTAARIVHEGCSKVLHKHFDFAPVRKETENSRVTIQSGFDPTEVRLTGNIVGTPPFTGTLVHRGWQVSAIRLPKLADDHNVNVVASAEVEL